MIFRGYFVERYLYILLNLNKIQSLTQLKYFGDNHLVGGPVVRAWDQDVCFFCGLRFEPCGCSYDGH